MDPASTTSATTRTECRAGWTSARPSSRPRRSSTGHCSAGRSPTRHRRSDDDLCRPRWLCLPPVAGGPPARCPVGQRSQRVELQRPAHRPPRSGDPVLSRVVRLAGGCRRRRRDDPGARLRRSPGRHHRPGYLTTTGERPAGFADVVAGRPSPTTDPAGRSASPSRAGTPAWPPSRRTAPRWCGRPRPGGPPRL